MFHHSQYCETGKLRTQMLEEQLGGSIDPLDLLREWVKESTLMLKKKENLRTRTRAALGEDPE